MARLPGSQPNVIAETDNLGNVQDYYIYGLGLVYKLMPDGSTYTYHFDSRGSTIAMTNATGQIVNQYSYGHYGGRLGIVEATPNPFGYVGRYGVMEEGNGLKFMRARYYDVTTGRFLNKDLVPGHIRNPQSLNRYAYVKNNPITRIDPLGLDSFTYFDESLGQGLTGLPRDLGQCPLPNNGPPTTLTQVIDDAIGIAGALMGVDTATSTFPGSIIPPAGVDPFAQDES